MRCFHTFPYVERNELHARLKTMVSFIILRIVYSYSNKLYVHALCMLLYLFASFLKTSIPAIHVLRYCVSLQQHCCSVLFLFGPASIGVCRGTPYNKETTSCCKEVLNPGIPEIPGITECFQTTAFLNSERKVCQDKLHALTEETECCGSGEPSATLSSFTSSFLFSASTFSEVTPHQGAEFTPHQGQS